MNTSLEATSPWWRRTLSQLGRDLAYLLTQLPLSVVAFSVAITLFSTAVGTVIIWVGVPLGAITLVVASWFAVLERKRLAAVTGEAPVASYSQASDSSGPLRRYLHVFTDPQRWRDLVYAIVDFPVGVFVWSAAVAWTAAALAGPTVWFWHRFVPGQGDISSVAILNWIDSVGGRTTIGLFALVTLPWVARGLVVLQQAMGEALLGSTDAQRLHAEVNRLETQGRVAASAEAQSLRRIERDLHDGPQQRLIRLAMDVQQAEAALEKDPAAARLALASAREQSAEALAELRQLTRGIAPPILVERGLAAALESLAERGTIPVEVDVELDRELGAASETALYFVASEALANIEKHAAASEASITVSIADGRVTIVIADDGVGGAHPAKGRGLAGLADRVEGAGGTLTVADAQGGGTIVTAEVPCG
jgi:signal transduction histidine kinase